MPFTKHFKLNDLILPNNVFYAPMAGCTDFPQRQITTKFRPGLVFCEMIKMEPLCRHLKCTKEILDYSPSMHPIGAQICGSNLTLAATSAKIIEDMGFDVIDFNCGCPVRKVVKDGSGAAMLKTPSLIGDIISQIKSAVKIPVTVKIRAGWDDNSYNCASITTIAEQAGASAIIVHGRTAKQMYKGLSNWDHIKACKAVANNIKVIGNGDLYTYEDVLKMFNQTNCDGVMIARGMLKNPALISNIHAEKYFLEECLLEHLMHIENYWKKEKKVFLKMRQASFWYLKRIPGTKKLRTLISQTKSPQELKTLVEEKHLWENFIG
jgi:nifR3 family TIM-barrel protein